MATKRCTIYIKNIILQKIKLKIRYKHIFQNNIFIKYIKKNRHY